MSATLVGQCSAPSTVHWPVQSYLRHHVRDGVPDAPLHPQGEYGPPPPPGCP
jgi:hypothetical protein